MNMKYWIAAGITIFIFSCTNVKEDKTPGNKSQSPDQTIKETTSVEIIDAVYDFGKITEGEKVEYNYRFKNTGNKSLIIIDAEATCGCTVPEKPEKPILPGELGFIKVAFDSKGKKGHTQKSIRITSNAIPEFPELLLTGEILAKE